MAAYTTIDDPEAYFQTVVWTGNGTDDRTITLPGDTNLQPDFIWVKNRTDSEDHCLMDVVRTFASGKAMRSNGADAEGGVGTAARGWVEAASDGFTCQEGSTNFNLTNASSDIYVAWCWKAGGSASAQTDGTIDTSRSASTTAGFSIATYTGNSTNGATRGHGLGVVPHMIVVKNRSDDDQKWYIYHHKNTAAPETDYLELNSTAATTDQAGWNDTAPSSTLVTTSDGSEVNASSKNYVMYSWAGKQGFSKFGSYIGNGNASGPVIWTGFKPAMIIIKKTSATGNWVIYDNKREGYNPKQDDIKLNTNAAEGDNERVLLLANGFKVNKSDAVVNTSGATFVYMAWAEAPFVNSNGVPTTAR